ncbi:MAG: alpha/beta hydrolase [Roseivirga sp.]|nr:alpha/beta hydrolase [Roseivirga sp.]
MRTKSKLLILSDLWGKEKSDWLEHYTEPLNESFELQYYDCCELGSVNKTDYRQEALHQQFVNGGIEKALNKLTELEKEPVHVLAFSIGGTIAWQFALKTGSVKSLYAISSTRLRYETAKPEAETKLYFGENDPFKPSDIWFDELGIALELISHKGHMVYTESEFAKSLSQQIR